MVDIFQVPKVVLQKKSLHTCCLDLYKYVLDQDRKFRMKTDKF